MLLPVPVTSGELLGALGERAGTLTTLQIGR